MGRLEKLTEWVRNKHSGQFIKKSGKPYFEHLIAVANMAAPVTRLGYEIGLCHDLIEKTETLANELRGALLDFGYFKEDAGFITGEVVALTNLFTKRAYPGLKKSIRKQREDERLAGIDTSAQTVKYADLIYNIDWVMTYDLKHAEEYLIRKRLLLSKLNKGNSELYQMTIVLIERSLSTFVRNE